LSVAEFGEQAVADLLNSHFIPEELVPAVPVAPDAMASKT